MAISTFKTFLMISRNGGTSWEKLIDIKDFPDLGGVPEMLDTTTMSNKSRTYILGIQETEAMTFTANYTLTDFMAVKALEETEQDFAVWLGGTVAADGTVTPTGSDGKYIFKGLVTATKTGGGVNEVQDMTITIAPTTDIDVDAGVGVTLNKHRLSLTVGDEVTLTATKNPADATLTWESSNTSVATVSSGVVTAEGAGVAVITATVVSDGVYAIDTCIVNVKAAE